LAWGKGQLHRLVASFLAAHFLIITSLNKAMFSLSKVGRLLLGIDDDALSWQPSRWS
jgi:hypothetical protein